MKFNYILTDLRTDKELMRTNAVEELHRFIKELTREPKIMYLVDIGLTLEAIEE